VSDNAGKTVREILVGKKGSVKDARLVPGSPNWDELMDVPWEEIVRRAKARVRGYKTIKKLLTDTEYDK
jgi:hypothetical protein